MGIGAIYKELTFDGEQSGDYGLYITGAGTFNAPTRDVEMVTIPGRNGSFAHDRGRFDNIEVTYPAGVYGSDESDFADKIADIRAWLCSKKGYVRLIDEYNPNEFRLAVYKSGLEVTPALLKAGEFDLVFECKPQRFLTSGETAQTIASSGDTLTNPTLFNARPMLEVDGYGKIGINNDEVEIISGPIGRITLAQVVNRNQPAGLSANFTISLGGAQLNSGDGITVIGAKLTLDIGTNVAVLDSFTQSGNIIQNAEGLNTSAVVFNFYAFSYPKGVSITGTASVNVGIDNGGIAQYQTITVSVSTNANAGIEIAVDAPLGVNGYNLFIYQIRGNSSKSALGEPIYLDLDIGEAWKVENGEVVSVNNSVSLGYEMPELVPGTNTITFDNTVTQLKIVPRWWTV